MTITNKTKINKFIAIILINIFCLSILMFFPSKAQTIEPTKNQYIEFRIVSMKDVVGKDKQLIVEVWSHEIDLKGFDIRYQYDSSVIRHSNILSNEYTDDEEEFFSYSNSNEEILELYTIPMEVNTATRFVCALLPEEDRAGTNTKIVNKGERNR